MQDLGFGLTVAQIQKLAFQLAESVRKNIHLMEKRSAAEWLCKDIKTRYGAFTFKSA